MFPRNKIPTLYCDVDGVINIASRRLTQGVMVNTVKRTIPTMEKVFPKFPIRFAWQEHIAEQLSSLPVKFVWLTTWNNQAVTLLEPLLGVKSVEVLHYQMRFRELRTQKSKYDLLLAHQKANPSPFIWVDDVATKRFNPTHWEGKPDRLIIQPNPKLGITQDHLTQMTSFLDTLNLFKTR